MDLKRLTKIVTALVVLLVIQFLLGMAINLYPSSSSTSAMDPILSLIIVLHIILGIGILGLAIYLRFKTMKVDQGAIKKSIVIGLAGVGIALLAGFAFLFTSNGIFSYLMAIGFVVAFASYVFVVGILSAQGSKDLELDKAPK